MNEQVATGLMSVRPFEWKDWYDMWKLNAYQLAEYGIIIDVHTMKMMRGTQKWIWNGSMRRI
jgi:hypothetical protein